MKELSPGSIGESGTGGYGQDCWLVAGLNVLAFSTAVVMRPQAC